jgi:RimJ/RimL family protein N-acetyltransferase
MTAEVVYAPLQERDIDELATALHNQAVYEHIGGMPSRADFELWLRRAMAGPPPRTKGERWMNVVARMAATGQVIGRLEASIHDGIAEVAFLYDPSLWGQGFASRGLLWLHDRLRPLHGVHSLWAATHPANHRSAALLLRCGYAPASTLALPMLFSYDEGDLVFRCGMVTPVARAGPTARSAPR